MLLNTSYGEDSFELGESLTSDPGTPQLFHRTPKVLARSSSLNQSASSVEIDSDLENSQQKGPRSVTFKKRRDAPPAFKGFPDNGEVLTDDEDQYSEDFDDAATALSISASYAEDFEPEKAFERSTGSAGYYSDDFERSTGSVKRKEKQKPAPTLDELLRQLSSSTKLPTQVAHLREQIGRGENGAQLENLLEQLEVDLIVAERKKQVDEVAKEQLRLEAQERADERRLAHESNLEVALKEAEDLKRELVKITSQREDLKAHLTAAQSAKDASHAARAALAEAAVLRTKELDALKKRCSVFASESGVVAAKLHAAEEAARRAEQKRSLETEILRESLVAAERRHDASLNKLPEFEERRLKKEEATFERKQADLELEKAAFKREQEAAKKEQEATKRELQMEHDLKLARLRTEADEVHRALQTAKSINEDTARRERERLSLHSANLDATRAAVARDRAGLEVAMGRLAEERAEFLERRAALGPSFAQLEAAELRSKKAEKDADKKIASLEKIAEQTRHDRNELAQREAAVDAESNQSLRRHRSATEMERAAASERGTLVQRAAELEKTRFGVLTQQAALARHVVAARHAASLALKSRRHQAPAVIYQQAAVVSPTNADPEPEAHDWPALPPPPAFDGAPTMPDDAAATQKKNLMAMMMNGGGGDDQRGMLLSAPGYSAYDDGGGPLRTMMTNSIRPPPPPMLEGDGDQYRIMPVKKNAASSGDGLPEPGSFSKAARGFIDDDQWGTSNGAHSSSSSSSNIDDLIY